jgi:hypothetical protein
MVHGYRVILNGLITKVYNPNSIFPGYKSLLDHLPIKATSSFKLVVEGKFRSSLDVVAIHFKPWAARVF